MSDMGSVIVPKSDQLNADDLIAWPITIKISGVTIRTGQEQPISIHFEGDNGKPYKACKSMCRLMVTAWGPDSKKYAGRSMTLYRDASVKWAGMEVGGIRISHMSDIDSPLTMALTMTKGSKKPYTVRPLIADAGPSVEYITPEQVVDIETRCQDAGIPLDKLKEAVGVTALALIPADKYASVNKKIDVTIASKRSA